jgi:hypothetical protein
VKLNEKSANTYVVSSEQFIAICYRFNQKQSKTRLENRRRSDAFHQCKYSCNGIPYKNFFFAKILSLFFRFTKTRCLRNSVFSLYENKVLQLIASGASLERFGEKDLVFIN